MDIFLVAHGKSQNYPQTFIPAGMSVTLFNDLDFKLDQSASLMSMTLLAEAGAASNRAALVGPAGIENRELTALSKVEFERVKRAVGEGLGGVAYTPGQDGLQEPIRLCEAPAGSDLCANGVHRCYGLLRQIYDSWDRSGRIYLVYCRGTHDGSPLADKIVAEVPGGSDHIYLSTHEAADRLIKMAFELNKTAFFDRYDRLPARSQDILRSRKPDIVGKAITARRAERVFQQAGGDLMNVYDLSEKGEEAGAALMRHYLGSAAFRQLVSQETNGDLGSFASFPTQIIKKCWGWYKLEPEERIALMKHNASFRMWHAAGEREKKYQLEELRVKERRLTNRQAKSGPRGENETGPSVSSSDSFEDSDNYSSGGDSPRSPAKLPEYYDLHPELEWWQRLKIYFDANWNSPSLKQPVDAKNLEILRNVNAEQINFWLYNGRLILGFEFNNGTLVKDPRVGNVDEIFTDTATYLSYHSDCYRGKIARTGELNFGIADHTLDQTAIHMLNAALVEVLGGQDAHVSVEIHDQT
ncbi:hypothetical protein [Streptomyces sp. NBC_00096]|uniref:hypothetical protein n=1 Tax=Streptomyces sp. NBC_00096 TaxID=2975650 RepID=UPI0032556B7E